MRENYTLLGELYHRFINLKKNIHRASLIVKERREGEGKKKNFEILMEISKFQETEEMSKFPCIKNLY